MNTVRKYLAWFPFIKTLDGFNFDMATGVPKAQIQELATLAFIERMTTAHRQNQLAEHCGGS